jgi:Dolichyl-phosphate-mannose-protein mannosyltransferase
MKIRPVRLAELAGADDARGQKRGGGPWTEIAVTRPQGLLVLALALVLLFRFWLADVLPFTSDEAYYTDMGRHPDWGSYDHPPMISWWLALQLYVSDTEWWLRLPSVLQPMVLAIAVRSVLPRVWPDVDAERASWAALLVALAPLNVWNVLITTDTPLIYFSVLSGLAWLMAARKDDPRWYFLSGLLLACAVLSKYFAFLLGFAYLVDVALRRTRGAWTGLAIAYACTVPALALMAWWNAGHCWVNVMFNFFTRTEDAGVSWKTPLLYAAALIYALTPPVLFRLPARGVDAMAPETRTASLLALVPLLLFAALALVKRIGLHWVLAFVVFAFLPLARRLPIAQLRRLGIFFIAFAALHVAVFVVISRLPLEMWNWSKHYTGIVLTVDSGAIVDKLKPYEGKYIFSSDDYSIASTVGYAEQRAGRSRFIVFGKGSHHGRQDDIDTDFRSLDGRDILILTKTASASDAYRPYFLAVETRSFEWRGAQFWIILGRGFKYPTYRDTILAHIRQHFYALPVWLPQTGCYLCERYFSGTACSR